MSMSPVPVRITLPAALPPTISEPLAAGSAASGASAVAFADVRSAPATSDDVLENE